VVAVRQDHVALDGDEPVLQLFDERYEGQVEEEDAVAGVVRDEDDLILEQARVDRVVDRADAGDAVPQFEVPPGVPSHRCDPVARADAVERQPLGGAQGTLAHLRVCRAVDRPFDRAGYDLSVRMLLPGMIDDAVNQQRPVLHEAKHRLPPSMDRLVRFFIGEEYPLAGRCQGAPRRKGMTAAIVLT
jgi:hypothetical protein